MNRLLALLGLVVFGVCVSCGGSSGGAASPADESRPALEAAQHWLTALDSANYDETWSQAATVFRTANGSPANWASAAGEMRAPLGAVASRRVREVAPAPVQAGAGYTFAFDSAFEARPNVTEEVTVLLEGGFWRVAGYLLR